MGCGTNEIEIKGCASVVIWGRSAFDPIFILIPPYHIILILSSFKMKPGRLFYQGTYSNAPNK